MALRHWFLPHPQTHKKAHLISWEGLVIYILLFIFLQVGFSILSYSKPGILGISSQISVQQVIELTNKEREKLGLSKLSENSALDQAAELKAQNMFGENYWAHFAPSGKTPWDFILGSGYKFTYAGENLAKNFYNSPDVVSAWMASPTHRDNLLNSKYQDIGIAVVEGVLNGTQTTLVVQMFGTTAGILPQPTFSSSGKQVQVPKQQYLQAKELVASAQRENQLKPLIDPYLASKTASLAVITLIVTLLLVDFVILKRRGVFRVASSRVAHMAILGVAAATLLSSSPGAIL